MITYSIIIPHKNTTALLQRCLDSIPKRGDIQIIIIDDNSDSDKVDFSIFPGLNGKNTEVYFTKEGKGAGYARNIGLQHAKGKWLIFADSDDLFVEDAFGIFDSYADSDNTLIYFNVTGRYSDNLEKVHDRVKYVTRLFDKYDGSQLRLNDLKYGWVGPVAKMYSKNLISKYNITFDEVMASNDMMFSLKTAFYAGDLVSISKDTVYCVTYREESLTSIKNYSSYLCRYKVTLSANTFLKNRGLYKYRHFLFSKIVNSIQFGLLKPFELIYLAIKSNNNPFSNMVNYISKRIEILHISSVV